MSHEPRQVPIRPAQPADVREIAALWCQAFPGRRTVDDRVRMLETGGRYGGLETVLVGRDETGTLVAACKIYRLTQRICGVAVPMMGLAAVAVPPAARRRGLGASLCTRAMEVARARGDVVSVLYPFRPDYYERLGWGLVGELHEYRFSPAHLPSSDGARRVREVRGAEALEAVSSCYRRVAAASHGPLERDERIWGWRLGGGELGVGAPTDGASSTDRGPRVIVYDGESAGYALLRSREGRLRIDELVAETEEAYRGLLGYIAARADNWRVARHTARVEERFGDRLIDPRPPDARRVRSLYFPTARIIRGPMLRVLDVGRALELRRYFHAAPAGPPSPDQETLEIRVHDPQLPDNSGPWTVRPSEAAVTVTPTAAPRPDAKLETDAATFARIYMGDLAPGDAARTGRARIEGNGALLDRAFATRERCWILDEF